MYVRYWIIKYYKYNEKGIKYVLFDGEKGIDWDIENVIVWKLIMVKVVFFFIMRINLYNKLEDGIVYFIVGGNEMI